MVWVALIGTALQAIGLVIAIKGLSETYSEALDRSLVGDLREDWKRWVRAPFRRGRRPQVVYGTGAGVTATVAMSVSGQIRQSKPVDDATDAERLDYLMRFVEVLSNETAAARQDAKELVREMENKTDARIGEITSRLDETDQRLLTVRAAVLGPDGLGLRHAAIGLSVTFVGVVLSIAGLPWDA